MELTNEFTVPVPVEVAWELLTDVERIAPCMPGATLESADDGLYGGVVKVKVGPVTVQYRGTVRFLERDDTARRAVLRAEGRETKGQGNANATITAVLVAHGDATAVTVSTDLSVTGRVAQFGRGVMNDVSARLLAQFVDCLEASLDVPAPAAVATGPDAAAAAPGDPGSGNPPSVDAGDSIAVSSGANGDPGATGDPAANGATYAASTTRRAAAPEGEAVDLLAVVGASIAKRARFALAAGCALIGGVAFWAARRRRHRR